MIKNKPGGNSAGFLISIANVNSEKGKSAFSVIFHSCGFRKLSCVDAESGNAGKFHIGEITGFSFGYGAGIAKAASA
jgi:hypothetical protein